MFFIVSQLSLKRRFSGDVGKYEPKIWVKLKTLAGYTKTQPYSCAHFLPYVAVTQIPSNVFSCVWFCTSFVLPRLFCTRSWWESAFHDCDMIL